MRASARIILLTVLLHLACSGAVLAQDTNRAAVQIYAKARREYQSRAAQLPEVAVNTTSLTAVFTKVDLSTGHLELAGQHLYAFRFHTPAPYGDLLWAVRIEPGMTALQYAPAKGTADPWSNQYGRRLTNDVTGVARKGDWFRMVSTMREGLERDTDYIAWLVCSAPVTTEFVVSLNMMYDLINPLSPDPRERLTAMFPAIEVMRIITAVPEKRRQE